MKLHDLKPAEGSRKPRKRVGRGIAAGQGKTAGRGTKGQKARAGGSIQPWFEGGQTPLHMRIPKLRGFKNRFKIEYEVVNVGRIGEVALLGTFESGESPAGKASAKAAPVTVNQDILRAVGLVRTLTKPLKILGQGDIEVALFIVADAFSKSAIAKIEAAGGSVQVLEVPTGPLAAIGLGSIEDVATRPQPKIEPEPKIKREPKLEREPTTATKPKVDAHADAHAEPDADAAPAATTAEPTTGAKAATKPKAARAKASGRKSKSTATPDAIAEPAANEPADAPADDAPADEAPTDEDA